MFIFGGAPSSSQYQIPRSLRFRSSASAYLSWTPSASPTNRKKFTISAWVKKGGIAAHQTILSSYTDANNRATLFFNIDDTLFFQGHNSGSLIFRLATNALFRDPAAWYHVVAAYDSTPATPGASDMYIEVNGVRITSLGTATYPAQNTELTFNTNVVHYLGQLGNSANYINGYLAEVNFVDGQKLASTDFGQTNPTTGAWDPIAYTGTYGTNGCYLAFGDTSANTAAAIGKDTGLIDGTHTAANNWTPSGIDVVTAGATNDSLVDVPTNYGTDSYSTSVDNARGNYCTINPLDKSAHNGTITNGNLLLSGGAGQATEVRGTIFFDVTDAAGFYFEGTWTTVLALRNRVGIKNSAALKTGTGNGLGELAGEIAYVMDGNYQVNGGSKTSWGAAMTTGQVVGVLVKDGKVYIRDNAGTWMNSGDPDAGTGYLISGLTGLYAPAASVDDTGHAIEFNFGQRPFLNAAPTSAKALCTQNLPDPAIPEPSGQFDATTYTGNGTAIGSGGKTITGIGFAPDLVWLKGRSGATSHGIYDIVRDVEQDWGSDLTTDETNQTEGLTSFTADGYVMGSLAKLNTNAATYVGWSWKGGSTAVAGSGGGLTSLTQSVNATAGTSIVAYTGHATAGDYFNHGLGVAPGLVIIKPRTTAGTDYGATVWHSSLANTEYLVLSSTAAKVTAATTFWNSTTPDSTKVTLSTAAQVNANADTFVAYTFAPVEGFSKFGSYTGNANANGPFVWCGFRPRYLLIKSSTAVDAWLIYDTAQNTYNVAGTELVANTTAANATITGIDFLANGFKLRTITTTPNAAQTYVFAAFAESPFKTSRAR